MSTWERVDPAELAPGDVIRVELRGESVVRYVYDVDPTRWGPGVGVTMATSPSGDVASLEPGGPDGNPWWSLTTVDRLTAEARTAYVAEITRGPVTPSPEGIHNWEAREQAAMARVLAVSS